MSLPRGPEPSGRQRRLGQNFIRDPAMLDLIVRESGIGTADVVLEVGGGGGALTERVAPLVRAVHLIEVDESLRPGLEELAVRLGNVRLLVGDALRVDLRGLDPAPTAVVANLPYAIATPFLVETVLGLPGVGSWLVMVQREIADRLRAAPGSRLYGSPTAVIGTCCRVELVRYVGREVFSPPPRVDSALLRVRRTSPPPARAVAATIREAFAHRRKPLARSLELAGAGRLEPARKALRSLGLPVDARAEALSPDELAAIAKRMGPACSPPRS